MLIYTSDRSIKPVVSDAEDLLYGYTSSEVETIKLFLHVLLSEANLYSIADTIVLQIKPQFGVNIRVIPSFYD